MRAAVFPGRERFLLIGQFPARMTALRWLDLPRRSFLLLHPNLFRLVLVILRKVAGAPS